MSALLRAVFPRNDVTLRCRLNSGEIRLFGVSPILINGFSIQSMNNILSIHSSNEFDSEFSSFLRIPLISDHVNLRLRTILGYVVIGNDGHFRVWTRSMSYSAGILPSIYLINTEFSILLQFKEPFESIFCLYRSDIVVNTQHLRFTISVLLAEDNVLVGSTNNYRRFVCYDNAQYTAIRSQFYRQSIPVSRSLDPNAHCYQLDFDLHSAILYYGIIMIDRYATEVDPPYFDNIYDMLARLEAPSDRSGATSVCKCLFRLFTRFFISVFL